MPLSDDFTDALARVKTLAAAPDNRTLLALYALFKQASVGDVDGKRPGMLDLKGRAKYDAWAEKKGLAKDTAMTEYVGLVDRLVAKK